jgi:hypothetical protein
MRKLALLFMLSSLLAGCTNDQMNQLTGKRPKTYNDADAAWVGRTEDDLIARWGVPANTYTLENGAKIVSYEDSWGPFAEVHTCIEKFMIEKGVVTKWGFTHCPSTIDGWLPYGTPIPQPTL